jgi:3-oxoacyl-[acyl-carrier protein] reductase
MTKGARGGAQPVAVVTGASRGIGLAIARRLAAEGHIVICTDIDGPGTEQSRALIEKEGGRAEAHVLDVTDEAAFARLVEEITSRWGRLDVLVNNAGIRHDALLMRMKSREWERVLQVNLTGTFNGIKAVTRTMMKQRHGVIVNLASVVALTGNAGQANYVASKAGVVGLTKSAALELGSRGIRVLAIAPGFIDTEMTQDLTDEVKKTYLQQVPLGRPGSTEDVANVVAFLVSSQAAYLTGQVIQVDGGLHT